MKNENINITIKKIQDKNDKKENYAAYWEKDSVFYQIFFLSSGLGRIKVSDYEYLRFHCEIPKPLDLICVSVNCTTSENSIALSISFSNRPVKSERNRLCVEYDSHISVEKLNNWDKRLVSRSTCFQYRLLGSATSTVLTPSMRCTLRSEGFTEVPVIMYQMHDATPE